MNNDKIEVSRELAESLMNGTESMGWSLAEELRALLAAAPYQCLDGGKCGNGGYCDACPHTKPSAQLQSDPVAIGYIQGIGERFIGKAEYDPRNGYVIPIYASPPAPVAVVLPERKTQGIHQSHELDECFKDGWNAHLDEVIRLNTK